MITGWTNVANFSITAAGIMIALFGLIMAGVSRYADKRTRLFLILFFATLILALSADIVAMHAQLYTKEPLLTQTAIFLNTFFSSLLLPLIMRYMVIRYGGSLRSFAMNLIDLLWIGFFLLLCYAQTRKDFYYVSEDNVMHRGPLYPVLLSAPTVIMLVMLITLIVRRNRLTRRQFIAFFSYIVIPAIAVIIQMKFYGIHVITLGTSVAAGVMLILLLADQAELNVRQQRRIADQQASLMVLQMRPHFIYNTMMSIYYLCAQDVKKAQSVILDFSTYLRKNFTALSNPDLIPFEEELEHARAYLAVEQVRFEDKLFVKYDTPFTDFNLPSLTLQPLVENCVKHGVDPELDPLTIFVRTKKTDTGYDVIVADNGPGFDSSENTAGNRVALSNIEERLRMCGGSIETVSRKGTGSIVTLHIPADD